MAAHVKDVSPKLTRRQAENARAAIAVGKIVRKLQRHVDGEIEMTPGQIKSAAILLDKSLPTLSAVDAQLISDRPTLSLQECRAALKAYLLNNPAMITEVLNQPRLELLEGDLVEVES